MKWEGIVERSWKCHEVKLGLMGLIALKNRSMNWMDTVEVNLAAVDKCGSVDNRP